MTDVVQRNNNEKVWMHLSRTYTVLERAREMELAPLGISSIQFEVLHFVKAAKMPATPAQLARWLHRQPHTVSGLLGRMEAQGLLRRTKDLERRNQVRLTLTRKGEGALKRGWNAIMATDATACLSKKELDVLNESSDKLYTKGIQLIREMQPYPYATVRD